MNATNTTRWIGIGLLGLPLYGALTFFSSMDPQPDSDAHYEAWSRFVTTDGGALLLNADPYGQGPSTPFWSPRA